MFKEETEQSDEQKQNNKSPNISVSTTMALNRFGITIITITYSE